MDEATSSQRSSVSASTSATRLPPVTSVYAASSLNAEITVFVLLTGILVGLLMVVVVLCVCKCCLKPNKPLKRQQVVFTKYSSEREESTWNGQKDSGGNSTGSGGGGGGGRYGQSATTPTSGREASSPTKSSLRGGGGGLGDDVELGVGSDNDLCDVDEQNAELIVASRQSEESGSPLLEVMTFMATGDNRVFQECSRESTSRNQRHQYPHHHHDNNNSLNHPGSHHHHHHHQHHHHRPTRHTRSSSPPSDNRRVGHHLPSCSTAEDDRNGGRRFPRSPPIQRQSPICSQTSDECPPSPLLLDHHTASDRTPSVVPPTPSTSAGTSTIIDRYDSTEMMGLRATLASPEESSSLEDDAGCNVITTNNSSGGGGGGGGTNRRVSAEVHPVPSEMSTTGQIRLSPNVDAAIPLFPRCVVPKATSLSSRSLDEQKREPEVTLKQQRSSLGAGDDESSYLIAVHRQRPLLRPASTSNIDDTIGSPPEIKHVPSTEDGVLEHMMELRRSENSRLLFSGRRRKTRGSPSSDDDEDDVGPRSKVRYNDTGSREEVNEEVLDLLLMTATTDKVDVLICTPVSAVAAASSSSSIAMPNREMRDRVEALASSQSRKLWELRATFEEDEELSDTLRMDEIDPSAVIDVVGVEDAEDDGDDGDGDRAEDCENDLCHTNDSTNCEKIPDPYQTGVDRAEAEVTSGQQCIGRCSTTSLVDVLVVDVQSSNLAEAETTSETTVVTAPAIPATAAPPQLLTLPSTAYESRRQSYKNILSKRSGKKSSLESQQQQQQQSGQLHQSTSVENSFDSVETTGTEASSSTDASCRLEAISTSMESTTDNTDSTGEGQIHHRLQQMKHDSGYKSLETGNGSKSTIRKQIHFAVEDGAVGGTSMSPSTSELMQMVQQQQQHLEDVAVAAAATLELPVKMIHQAVQDQDSQRGSGSGLAGSGSSSSGGRHLVRAVERGGSGKTASKKRREYTRERQIVETSFGMDVLGQEYSSSLDEVQHQQQQQEQQGKSSVFVRFFQSSSSSAAETSSSRPPMSSGRRAATSSMTSSSTALSLAKPGCFSRDFSIDEKSDSLFREFSRREPSTTSTMMTSSSSITGGGGPDMAGSQGCKSPRLHSRHHRLYHRHRHGGGHHGHHGHALDGTSETSSTLTGPGGGGGIGSSGAGTGSCVGVGGSGHMIGRTSKLSPQDSIEEEKRSVDAEDACFVLDELHTAADIPIIKVAAEDSS